MSVARTPEQNGVVERRNRTLVEAARTMLSAAKVPLFLWAEAIATACFTQNRSLVIHRHEKTPYHIINDRKSSVKFFHIFGSICYIVKDGKNLDKIKEKGDECIFVGYSTQSRAYRVFNKRTRVIMGSIHVNFDELPHMASDQISSDPAPEYRTVTMSNELDLLFSLMFDELLNGSSKVVSKSSAVYAADAPYQRQNYTTPLNIHTTPAPTCQVQSLAPTVTSSKNINQAETYAKNDQVADDEFINIFCTPVQDQGETSSRHEAMADSAWIESMQEELHQFDRLDVWELVDRPLCINVINLKWLWKNKRDEENTVIRNKSRLALVHNSSDPALSRQEMASVQNSTDPGPTCQKKASVQISSDPAPKCQTMALEHNSLSPGRNCQENFSHRDNTVHISSDPTPEFQTMASDQNSSDPTPECQTMALEHDSLSPKRKCQENVSHGDKTVTTLNELDLLFSPMFDELLNGPSQAVSKSSAVSAADAPNKQLNAENDQVADDEFINIFSTPVQDRGEVMLIHQICTLSINDIRRNTVGQKIIR
nr:Gag-Pol polyprotein [Tanacetum cinerariifolium]